MQTFKSNLQEVYEVGPQVGKGRFAKVFMLTRKSDGLQFAGKYQNKRRAAKHIDQEIQVYKLCSTHARFPTLHEIYETSTEIVMVLDYAAGGEIYPYCVGTDPLSPDDEDSEGIVFSEYDVMRYMIQILEGVLFLHQNNIVHLDIKPHNILLSAPYPEGDIVLVDFGLSRLLEHSREQRVFAGTPDYLAPELVSFDPVTPATDIWSLGVVCYVMLTGHSPFAGDNAQETSNNICKVDYGFPDDLFGSISQPAQDFVSSIFKKNPKLRPTVQQLLKHPWLQLEEESSVKTPPKSVSSPGGISWDLTDFSPQSQGSEISCISCNQKSPHVFNLPGSYSADAIGRYLHLADEHCNSSDSAICGSDEDKHDCSKSSNRNNDSVFSNELCSPVESNESRKTKHENKPARIQDFKRLSLKRKSSEKRKASRNVES